MLALLSLLDLVYMFRSTLAATLLKIIALPVPLLRQVFRVLFGCPKGSQEGPQKGPKSIKKRSRNGISKRVPKKLEKRCFSDPPTPLWIELWLQRELDSHFLIRCVFGTLLGLILEVFWEAKWLSLIHI